MNKRFRPLLLLAGLSLLLLSSCSERLYFPDRANSPGLTEEHQFKGTLSFKPQINEQDNGATRGAAASFAADVAFAPVEHLGLIASYRNINNRFTGNGSSDLDASYYGGRFFGNRVEFGAGYWDKFSRHGRFELYAGYGNGSLQRRSYDPFLAIKNFDTRYHRFFLQPAVGIGNHIISVMGGMRFAFQKYYNFESPYEPTLRYHVLNGSMGELNVEREIVGFIEPYVNMEVGYKFIRFNYQLGFSGQYIGARVAGEFPVYMSLGMTIDLAPSYLR